VSGWDAGGVGLRRDWWDDPCVTPSHLRRALTVAWVVGGGAALYLALFHRDVITERLRVTSDASLVAGGLVYLAFGCIRGFTLLPATSLLLIGMLFFPPWPLFVLTVAGALLSAVLIYYFSEALRLDELLQRRHAARLDRARALLERRGLPIIIAWSFFPFTPTDLICYLSGVLRIRIWTMLTGVAIGKSAIVAAYIWLGEWALAK
jgi:uncharacterized membrane protein YdjX (TVP38/TMEM64 family)